MQKIVFILRPLSQGNRLESAEEFQDSDLEITQNVIHGQLPLRFINFQSQVPITALRTLVLVTLGIPDTFLTLLHDRATI